MALPKLDTPTYRLTIPSTREEIEYRPFLVKEQKLLMMAQESEDERQVIDTVGKLVSSCTFEKIDSDNSPLFDIEYVFLKIRGKSVGEKIKLNLTCPDDEKTQVETEIDLEDVSVQMAADHTNEIQITDTVKMFLKYPILKNMKSVASDDSQTKQVFEVLSQCIHEIHFGEQVFNRVDISKKDINEFIDQLTSGQFDKILDFFNTMPKLRHVIPVTNPKTKVESEVVVEGLASFLV
tara:strand:- start:438 stop:1145 length:708 start_codon:yes stop_codon:yes gene_type:complete